MKISEKVYNDNAEKEKRLMESGSGAEKTNGNKNESFKLFPKPLAKYSDVIADKALFMQTLEKFHSAMKTKFMIPIIGGKDLDLHKLFQEVTSRGGIDKVIADRRWKEVTASFTFPSTATNASFILRKYYYSLLHHYEQLYYFGAQGCNNIPDNMSSPLVQCSSRRPLEATYDTPSLPQKRKTRDELPVPVTPVTGVIDGKFEHGYFLTVKVGSQTLRGTLFYCPDQPPAHSFMVPQPINFNSGVTFTAGTSNQRTGPLCASASASPNLGARRQRRRRKRRPSTMDPNHPKPNRSGYNFFFAEQHAQLKPLHPGKDRDISRIIGERWNSLTEAEKNVYQERGRVDKQRYQSELALYKEKQKTEPDHVISDAVPINQRPASESDFTVEGVDIKVEEGNLVLANNTDQNSDSDDTDESDVDKSKDLDLDTGSVSGSESDTSVDATTLVAVECQSAGAVGPSLQTGSDGFELRKREVLAPSVELVKKTLENSNSPVEAGVKTNEGPDTLVEGDVKMGEGGFNNPVDGDLKAVKGPDNPVEHDVKMGELSNDPVEGDVKMGEAHNSLVQGNDKMVEDANNLVDNGAKSDADANNAVEGDVKSGEDVNNLEENEVKMAEVLRDIKTDEDFNSPTAAGVILGKELVTNQVMAVRVSSEERMVDTG